jgi:hypothetical protein
MPVYGLLLMGSVLPTRESIVLWLEVVILMAAAVWYLLLLEASPTALPPKLVVCPDLGKASSSLCFSPRCCHRGGQGLKEHWSRRLKGRCIHESRAQF